MAAPIISSIVAVPAVVPPGGTSVVTVTASDPDAGVGTLTVTVTDSTGNAVTGTTPLIVQDPLTYALADTDSMGFTITPRAGQPNVFDVVAP